jgi:hypothetical protein
MSRLGSAKGSEGEQAKDSHVLDLLPSYATALSLGQLAEARFPRVAKHLATCEECEAELGKLLQLTDPLFDDSLEPVDNLKTFDLPFLAAARSPDAPAKNPRRFDSLERLVFVLDMQLGALRDRFSPARQPSAMQVRGRPFVDYEPDPATTGGIGVSIQISTSEIDPRLCDLEIVLVLPQEVRAPNGIAARVHVEDVVLEKWDAERGEFSFERAIPLDATRLQITIHY